MSRLFVGSLLADLGLCGRVPWGHPLCKQMTGKGTTFTTLHTASPPLLAARSPSHQTKPLRAVMAAPAPKINTRIAPWPLQTCKPTCATPI